jgi:hypothetical protein
MGYNYCIGKNHFLINKQEDLTNETERTRKKDYGDADPNMGGNLLTAIRKAVRAFDAARLSPNVPMRGSTSSQKFSLLNIPPSKALPVPPFGHDGCGPFLRIYRVKAQT